MDIYIEFLDIPGYSSHSDWECLGILCGMLLVSQNTVMNLNNVTDSSALMENFFRRLSHMFGKVSQLGFTFDIFWKLCLTLII